MKQIIKVNNTSFIGYLNNDCFEFKGIRYADSKRFDVPHPYNYKDSIVDLKDDSPICYQGHSKIESFITGNSYASFMQVENPQFLSITIPKDTNKNSLLPVMVFIHGGTFRHGGCDSPSYNRTYLVKENNIIVIGINYRLGAFGFSRDLNKNYANLGLLDIIEGLKWIKNNIKFFNGDPNNITIFGQSSGGEAVKAIVLSNDTLDLYKRVIIQSAPSGTMHHRENVDKYILDGINSLNENASAIDILEKQEELNSSYKSNDNDKFLIYGPHYGIYPLVDKKEINSKIIEVSKNHELLIGYNSREVSVYLRNSKTIRNLSKRAITKKIIEKGIEIKDDQLFTKDAIDFYKKYKKNQPNTYLYKLYWQEGESFLGGCHGIEFLLLFGASDGTANELMKDYTIEDIIEIGKPLRKLWADFAKTGKVEVNEIPSILKIDEKVK